MLLRPAALLLVLAACGGSEPSAPEAPPTEAAPEAQAAPEAPAPAERMNVNTASEEQLRTIPGVGDRMVHEFEEYRPYVSITQFRKEMGKYVDAETVAAYEAWIYVPVDPDESDAATLQQIPGVDEAGAQALIADRPYDDDAAFVAKVGAVAGNDAAKAAEAMLR